MAARILFGSKNFFRQRVERLVGKFFDLDIRRQRPCFRMDDRFPFFYGFHFGERFRFGEKLAGISLAGAAVIGIKYCKAN